MMVAASQADNDESKIKGRSTSFMDLTQFSDTKEEGCFYGPQKIGSDPKIADLLL